MSAPTLHPTGPTPGSTSGSASGSMHSGTGAVSATPGIWLLRVLGSILVLALALGGAVGIAAGFFQRSVTRSEELAAGTTAVLVEGDVGDVTVRQAVGSEQPRIVRTSHWAFDEPTSRLEQAGGRTTVTTDCAGSGGLGSCSVDVLAVLPAGVAVQVRTATGDISLRGLDAAVSLESTIGDVDARGLTGAQVSAQTGVGDIWLACDRAPTALTARAATGDVQVIVPASQTYVVTVTTPVGDQKISVPTADSATHTITATSSVGDVSVVGRAG